MTEIDYRIKTLVGLGRALTVLLVVLWLDRPCSEQEISRYTGYSRKTCRKYLEDLHEKKYIIREFYKQGWMVTGFGRQMILGEVGKNEQLVGKNYPLPFTTTTINKDTGQEEVEAVVNQQVGKNYPDLEENYPLDERSEIYDALTEAGIIGKIKDELAQREDLSVEIIQAFEGDLKTRKEERYSVGLLVHVLREYRRGDQVPEIETEETRRQKYVSGKYAEFINRS